MKCVPTLGGGRREDGERAHVTGFPAHISASPAHPDLRNKGTENDTVEREEGEREGDGDSGLQLTVADKRVVEEVWP